MEFPVSACAWQGHHCPPGRLAGSCHGSVLFSRGFPAWAGEAEEQKGWGEDTWSSVQQERAALEPGSHSWSQVSSAVPGLCASPTGLAVPGQFCVCSCSPAQPWASGSVLPCLGRASRDGSGIAHEILPRSAGQGCFMGSLRMLVKSAFRIELLLICLSGPPAYPRVNNSPNSFQIHVFLPNSECEANGCSCWEFKEQLWLIVWKDIFRETFAHSIKILYCSFFWGFH